MIKITDRELYTKSVTIVNGIEHKINENIKTEKQILKFLSSSPKCPESIIKYIDFFKSNKSYYLVMENGGNSLFKFIQKAHEYITNGYIKMSNWHQFVRICIKQMVECIDYLHSMNICHFDISLENLLINDINVEMEDIDNIQYICFPVDPNQVQIKLCDFGLAEYFKPDHDAQSDMDSDFKSDKFVGKPNYQSPEITSKKKGFNAKANDIFCLGVTIFMMIIGGGPFKSADENDKYFRRIMDGDTEGLLKGWKRDHYINEDILELFNMIFKYEDDRATIQDIKKCKWLRD